MIRRQAVFNVQYIRGTQILQCAKNKTIYYNENVTFDQKSRSSIVVFQARTMAGQIGRRSDTLENAERILFKYLAKTVRVAKTVRDSNEFHLVKETIMRLFYWLKRTFEKQILENPRIHRALNNFKEKLDRASEAENIKRNK